MLIFVLSLWFCCKANGGVSLSVPGCLQLHGGECMGFLTLQRWLNPWEDVLYTWTGWVPCPRVVISFGNKLNWVCLSVFIMGFTASRPKLKNGCQQRLGSGAGLRVQMFVMQRRWSEEALYRRLTCSTHREFLVFWSKERISRSWLEEPT